jgi:hypothetical protein
MGQGDAYQAECPMRQGIGDDRARPNEDEGERPDQFSMTGFT